MKELIVWAEENGYHVNKDAYGARIVAYGIELRLFIATKRLEIVVFSGEVGSLHWNLLTRVMHVLSIA